MLSAAALSRDPVTGILQGMVNSVGGIPGTASAHKSSTAMTPSRTPSPVFRQIQDFGRKESIGHRFQLLIDEKEAWFGHRGGSGAGRCPSRNQLETTNILHLHRDLAQDMKQCVRYLRSIADDNSAFQLGLMACLDLDQLTDTASIPLKKIRIKLISTGIYRTMVAFIDGYALRSFVRRADNANEIEDALKLNQFDADSTFDYFGSMV